MRKIIYETSNAKIYQDGESFELFAVTGRNYDGCHEIKMHLVGTFTDVYTRDALGRTTTWPHYNRSSKKGYAYEAVMQAVKYYEK